VRPAVATVSPTALTDAARAALADRLPVSSEEPALADKPQPVTLNQCYADPALQALVRSVSGGQAVVTVSGWKDGKQVFLRSLTFNVNSEAAAQPASPAKPSRLPRQEAPVVERGQAVTMVIETTCFRVTAAGRTQEAGAAGDCIRVENLDSHRTIMAEVVDAKTVRPLFERSLR
jgi:hypothetical protein